MLTNRRNLVARVLGLALAAVLLVTMTAPALAQGTWRVAGTFNGWNAGDDAWKLDSTDGRLELVRPLPVGLHRFKFVKDGAWDRGHLGAGPGGALVQPGEDLTIRVRHEATYAITLDPAARTWRSRVVRAEKPVVDARILGPVVERREAVLDLTESVSTDGRADITRFVLWSSDPEVRLLQEGTSLRFRFTPTGPGPLTIGVRYTEGNLEPIEVSQTLLVKPQAVMRHSAVGGPIRQVPLEPQADGTMVGLLRVESARKFAAIDVQGAEGEFIEVVNPEVAPGVYAAIVRDGGIVTSEVPGVPLVLHPGNWRTITYKPSASVDSVHLVGDVNAWAGPGQPGAIAMQAQTDGSFKAIVNVPDGPSRYVLRIDGTTDVLDPQAQTVQGSPVGPASVIIAGPKPEEFKPAQAGAIDAKAIRHNPASALDFSPISAGLGLADIGVSTLPGDVQRVTLNIAAEGGKTLSVPMQRSTDAAGFDRWSARVKTGLALASYSFTFADGPASTQSTVYERQITPAFETPDWAKGAVWYQIFAERFRNGNPLNDPHDESVYQKPWTDDWYTISAAEDAAWRKRYKMTPDEQPAPRQGGKLFHVVWDRRYGGDLQGVQSKLGELRELGVTAIYLNPVFEAESMHKYDATDFRHIDDNFGQPASAGKVPAQHEFKGEPADPSTWTWTPADRYFVDEFLPAARQAGIRIVLDGVWNHTGKPFFAFKDIMEKGDKSPYKDWFYVEFDEQGKLKSWVSWFNTGALPKFRQTADGDLVAPVKQHLFDVTSRWMDPNGDGDPSDGIDGWRLDVALDVGLPFWRDWRKHVKRINPQAIIIAEIWDDASAYVRGDVFDTQMHYPFGKPVLDWLGVRPNTPTSTLKRGLDLAFDDSAQTNLIHQNLFASHDTDRYVSMLLNPGREYDQGNRPQDHDFPYVDKKPGADVYQRSLLGVAIQALYTGAPMVYYGDEVGMWGADDPTNRKPYPWPDKGAMQNPDEAPDFALREQYKKWLNLRSDATIGPVLRFGATRHLDSGNDAVFAFERSLNGVRVIAVINRSDKAYDASKLLPAEATERSVAPVSAKYWVIEAK